MNKADIEKLKAEAEAKTLWQFSQLKLLGYVDDRATLRRWINRAHFPQPIILSQNSVAWRADEVRAWIDARPRGVAPQPPRPKRAA